MFLPRLSSAAAGRRVGGASSGGGLSSTTTSSPTPAGAGTGGGLVTAQQPQQQQQQASNPAQQTSGNGGVGSSGRQRPSVEASASKQHALPVPAVSVLRRIVILGARNSGKSSVAYRFAEARFENEYDPTIENTFRARIEVRGVSFVCDLLDTAGQDESSSFSRHATVGVHGYCMMFSLTSLQSFYAVQAVHDRITDLVGMFTVPIILVGTKSDDEENREVTRPLAEELARAWGCAYVECSAKSDIGVSEVFQTLLFEIERDSGLLSSNLRSSSWGGVAEQRFEPGAGSSGPYAVSGSGAPAAGSTTTSTSRGTPPAASAGCVMQ